MKIHIVQKGDTLWTIASKYNVNYDELKTNNTQLSNPEAIAPGMKIRVPVTNVPVRRASESQVEEEMMRKEGGGSLLNSFIPSKKAPSTGAAKKDTGYSFTKPIAPTPLNLADEEEPAAPAPVASPVVPVAPEATPVPEMEVPMPAAPAAPIAPQQPAIPQMIAPTIQTYEYVLPINQPDCEPDLFGTATYGQQPVYEQVQYQQQPVYEQQQYQQQQPVYEQQQYQQQQPVYEQQQYQQQQPVYQQPQYQQQAPVYPYGGYYAYPTPPPPPPPPPYYGYQPYPYYQAYPQPAYYGGAGYSAPPMEDCGCGDGSQQMAYQQVQYQPAPNIGQPQYDPNQQYYNAPPTAQQSYSVQQQPQLQQQSVAAAQAPQASVMPTYYREEDINPLFGPPIFDEDR